jgi:hypothetical protein
MSDELSCGGSAGIFLYLSAWFATVLLLTFASLCSAKAKSSTKISSLE